MTNGDDNGNGCGLHLFERNNYFYGKLMTVRDFEAEQDYFNGKRRLINRLVHGAGIVCGLSPEKMTISSGEKGLSITFGMSDGDSSGGGIALDTAGREIVVPDSTTRDIRTATGENLTTEGEYYLFLKSKPCLAEMVNAASSQSSCDDTCCPNRIREDFEVIAKDQAPEAPRYPPEAPCPELPESQSIGTAIAKFAATCPGCDDEGVFIAVMNSDNTIDSAASEEYRTYLFSNRLLGQLLTCHMTETNPHQMKHADLLEILGWSSDTTDHFDKHIRHDDADKWNSAVYGINTVTPDNGIVRIVSGSDNVTIADSTSDHSIRITVEKTGGGICYHGSAGLKAEEINNLLKGITYRIETELPPASYSVTLGLGIQTKEGQHITYTGDMLRNSAGVFLSSYTIWNQVTRKVVSNIVIQINETGQERLAALFKQGATLSAECWLIPATTTVELAEAPSFGFITHLDSVPKMVKDMAAGRKPARKVRK